MRRMLVAGSSFIALVALAAGVLALTPLDSATAQDVRTRVAGSESPTEASKASPSQVSDSRTGLLDELVEEEVISRAQADAIEERFRERIGETRKRRQNRRIAVKLFGDVRAVVVDATGLTREEFAAAWQSGGSFGEIATRAGLTKDELADALVTSATERIDRLLANGRINDDQAHRLGDGLGERAKSIVDRIWSRSRDARVPADGGPRSGARNEA